MLAVAQLGAGAEPSDLVLSRLHGLSPMTDTSLSLITTVTTVDAVAGMWRDAIRR